MNNPPPIIFGLLGVAVGVLVAWTITRNGPMALVFLVLGSAVIIGHRIWQNRR